MIQFQGLSAWKSSYHLKRGVATSFRRTGPPMLSVRPFVCVPQKDPVTEPVPTPARTRPGTVVPANQNGALEVANEPCPP